MRQVRGPGVVVLGFAVGVGVPMPAHAQSPEADAEPSRMPAHPGSIAIETPDDAAWNDAVAAIAFELDQAGFTLVRSLDPSAMATLRIERTGSEWRLVLVAGDGEPRVRSGPAEQSADIVALVATDMVLAAALGEPPHAPEPSPALDNEPPSRAAIDETTLATRAPRAESPHDTGWTGDFGASFTSIGLVGLGVGVRHRWTRLELGLSAEGGPLSQRREETYSDGSTTTVSGGGVGRVRIVGAFALRSGKRVRPGLGLASELVMPFASSSFAGPDPDAALANSTMTVTTSDVGLFWVPSAELSLGVRVRPRLGVRTALRVGPTVTLRGLGLADGSTLAFPGWFVGATTGLSFGGR